MTQGIVLLVLGAAFIVMSSRLAELELWIRGIRRLEATDPVAVNVARVATRWLFIVSGVVLIGLGIRLVIAG